MIFNPGTYKTSLDATYFVYEQKLQN